VSSYHCTVKVKSGQAFKSWSNSQIWSKERDLIANIDIFGCLCKIGLQN